MKEKLEELQRKYFQMSWAIEENHDGLSEGLYNLMHENLLTEYRREYDKLNGTEGLKEDKEIAELNRLRVKQNEEIKTQIITNVEETSIISGATTPRYIRHWLFWHRPNKAMQLTIESAQAQIGEYMTERENEVELQEMKLGAVPAELSDRLYNVFDGILPTARRKKKLIKREILIQELVQTLYKTMKIQCNGIDVAQMESDTKNDGEPDQRAEEEPEPEAADTL